MTEDEIEVVETSDEDVAAYIIERLPKLDSGRLARALGLATISEAARRLKVARHKLDHAISIGRCPAPTFGLKARLYYKPEQIPELKRGLRMGSNTPMFSGDEQKLIKELHDGGLTQPQIAELYNTSQSTISRVLRGRATTRKS